VLGGILLLGTTLVNGLNGAWIAGLLARRHRRARIASRAMVRFYRDAEFRRRRDGDCPLFPSEKGHGRRLTSRGSIPCAT